MIKDYSKYLFFIALLGLSSVIQADTAATTKPAAVSTTYLIGPGDGLKIFVWGNPDLSTAVAVRPDGLITTPLIEDIRASGLSPTSLARNLEKSLSKYVKNPKVTVTVTSFVGRYKEQIRVVGEAATPQSLPFKENMTVLDVIIAVGGLTKFAAGNRATLVRTVNGKRVRIKLRLDDLVKDGDIDANVNILPGDVIIIPESWF